MTIIARRSRWSSAIFLITLWCQLSHDGFRGLSFAAQIETPTVTAVQGDRFDGKDVASKFLIGCKRQCLRRQPQIDCSCLQTVYHVPDSWMDKEQIHLDNNVLDYGCFYRDKRVRDASGTPGGDESLVDGLEQSQIIFYAGHGNPDQFCAIEEEPVNLGDFSLGDVNVRYLFMVSCNVFAHGPRPRGGDFNNPNLFDATQFRAIQRSLSPVCSGPAGAGPEMANVFYRWGRDYGEGLGLYPLNPSLRLACGGSSLIGGAQEYDNNPTHLFWYYLSVRRMNPAHAWLVGLYAPGEAEPLCMSRGDSLKASGLGDPWFETAPMTGATPRKFVYIEYPVEGKANDRLVQTAKSGVPVKPVNPPQQPAEAAGYPAVLPVTPTSVPSILKGESQGGASLGYGFRGGAASVVAPGLLPTLFPPPSNSSVIKAEDVCFDENRASGSVAISWRPYVDHPDNPNTESELDTAATEFLLRLMALFKKEEEQQVPSDEKKKTPVEGVTAIQMKIDRVQQGALLTRPESRDGCFFLRQTRSVEVGQGEPLVRIFGEGSETFIGRCPAAILRLEPPPQAKTNPCEREGSPLAIFVYTNREIGKAGADFVKVALRKRDAVIAEARSKLELPADQADRYRPEEPRLGYRAAPAHCVQNKMYLVFEVDFKADDPQLPARTIEVPAQELAEARRMKEAWDCSPE